MAKSIGISASASVLPMNIQDWFSLGWPGRISLQPKGLSRVFSSTRVQKVPPFFNEYRQTYLPGGNRDSDVENKHLETEGEGRLGRVGRLGLTGLISLQPKGLSRVFSNTTAEKHQFFNAQLYSPTLTSIHDYWKNHSFDWTDLCWQSNVSAF